LLDKDKFTFLIV